MITIFNDDIIDSYLRSHTAVEDDVLRTARERAAAEDMPPVPPEVGSFLMLLARIVKARDALEIGSGGGASGVWITRGLAPDGTLTTIEIDPEHQRLAMRTYAEAGIADRVRPLLGHAVQVLSTLPARSIDFMLIDPAKREYPIYLDEALRLVRPGGLILADNVLWSGRVMDPRANDPEDEGIRTYNDRVTRHPRLLSSILPIGDGVSVSLVIE